MKTASVITVGLILLLNAATGQCQSHDNDKLQDRIETITIWKMMEAVDLDRGTADKIMEIRHKFLVQRKEIAKSLGNDFKSLSRLVKSPGSENNAEIQRLLTDIRQKRQKLRDLWDQQYTEVSKVLTLQQQAKLVLFLKDFQRELRMMLRGGGHRPSQPEELHKPDDPPPHPPAEIEGHPEQY